MEFSPENKIVRLCLEAMAQEDAGSKTSAAAIFQQAWNEATNDFEKYLAAFFLSRHQDSEQQKLLWLQQTLALAEKIDHPAVHAALPSLHGRLAETFTLLGNRTAAEDHLKKSQECSGDFRDPGPFYHGTRADLKTGDFLQAGFGSNYKDDLRMNHIYFTALLNGAGLAAALAKGDGPERVYIVEPTGPVESDPNVTNKKFPGNPTRSYRTQSPLRISGEVTEWQKVTPAQLQAWREKLANNKGDIIN